MEMGIRRIRLEEQWRDRLQGETAGTGSTWGNDMRVTLVMEDTESELAIFCNQVASSGLHSNLVLIERCILCFETWSSNSIVEDSVFLNGWMCAIVSEWASLIHRHICFHIFKVILRFSWRRIFLAEEE